MKVAILVVSDTRHNDEKLDESGRMLTCLVKEFVTSNILIERVPDEKEMIKEKLIEWTDENKLHDLILTTGGTGLAPRDVTPDATLEVIDKEIRGISFAMIMKSLSITEKAMLSRAVCGVRNKSLIINLPGSVKAVQEHFYIIKDILEHAVSLIKNDFEQVKKEHSDLSTKNTDSSEPSKVNLSAAALRNRNSPYRMINVIDARKIIFSVCIQTSEIELINIRNCFGRVLASDTFTSDPLPPFRASIKDGYALKISNMKEYTVDSIAKAGDAATNPKKFDDAICVRISTGAPVPDNANAVIPVEDTFVSEYSKDGLEELRIGFNSRNNFYPGSNIRDIGSDICEHSVILKKNSVLNAAEIGILAAVGKTECNVFKRLTVGVLSTGNELQEPNEKLRSGCIRDSNKITLLTLLLQYGYTGCDYGIVKDNPSELKWKLEKAMSECDLIITTGGVSMGEYDIVEKVLKQDFKAKIHFGSINMKPGKPTKFATCCYKSKVKYIFGLPGNPVSATVTWLLFVLPLLRYYENRPDVMFPLIPVELDFTPKKDDERVEYHRVKLTFGGVITKASSTGNQISSRLNSCVNADGLLILPSKYGSYESYGFDKPPTKPNNEKENLYWCYKLDRV